MPSVTLSYTELDLPVVCEDHVQAAGGLLPLPLPLHHRVQEIKEKFTFSSSIYSDGRMKIIISQPI
jgi:hypothetical protein